MKTILSMVFAVLAMSAAALAVADTAKAGTPIPAVHIVADAPVSTLDLGANMLNAAPRKPSAPSRMHVSNASAKHTKRLVCRAPIALRSDYAATVSPCEWM